MAEILKQVSHGILSSNDRLLPGEIGAASQVTEPMPPIDPDRRAGEATIAGAGGVRRFNPLLVQIARDRFVRVTREQQPQQARRQERRSAHGISSFGLRPFIMRPNASCDCRSARVPADSRR